MKFQLYASVRQTDGRILRFVRNFDSLQDVLQFLNEFKSTLCRDWHLVQRHDNVTDREFQNLYKDQPIYEYPEFPF